MITDKQRRNQSLRKLNQIPVDKWKERDDFIVSLVPVASR